LSENGLLDDYIIEFTDVLHTLGKEYIIEDIIGKMKEKGLI
jgi:hypothetical protein